MSFAEAFEQLKSSVDVPGFNYKGLILGFIGCQYAFETFLAFRQHLVLQKPTPPETLKKVIDESAYKKSQGYSLAKSRFSFFTDFFSLVQNAVIYKYNVLPLIWAKAGDLLAILAERAPKFLRISATSEIQQSLIFLFIFQIIQTCISVPIDYYKYFVLEEKFGMNKRTAKLFFTDIIKEFIVFGLLLGPFISGFLKIILIYGEKFVFYAWLLFFFFQMFMQTIMPSVIMPLFNKYEPLEDGELKSSIEDLAKKNKFPLTKLYVVDGSKRSAHSNAYFIGLPWYKQIVLFDTLIESSTTLETTAVLAHEIGHWALNHIAQMLFAMNVNLLFIFGLFSVFINNSSLYESFGFTTKPVLIGFLLFSDVLKPYECLNTFLTNLLIRKNEYQADNYALKQNYAEPLAKALVKLQKTNLSATDTDWLYSAYHYSHPTLTERLNALNIVPDEEFAKSIAAKIEKQE